MTGTVPRGQSGCRGRLFSTRDMYDIERTEGLFAAAVRENCAFHYRNCPEYRRILDYTGFRPESIEGMGILREFPFFPPCFLNATQSFPCRRIKSGQKSCLPAHPECPAVSDMMREPWPAGYIWDLRWLPGAASCLPDRLIISFLDTGPIGITQQE